MKNSINITNNVNLILSIYKCLFSSCCWEFLALCSTALTISKTIKTSQQESVQVEMIRSLQCLMFVNHNGTKRIDIWNVNKLTTRRTKMEVCQLRTRVAQWWSRWSLSSNKVGENVEKTNTDFRISIWNMLYLTCLF